MPIVLVQSVVERLVDRAYLPVFGNHRPYGSDELGRVSAACPHHLQRVKRMLEALVTVGVERDRDHGLFHRAEDRREQPPARAGRDVAEEEVYLSSECRQCPAESVIERQMVPFPPRQFPLGRNHSDVGRPSGAGRLEDVPHGLGRVNRLAIQIVGHVQQIVQSQRLRADSHAKSVGRRTPRISVQYSDPQSPLSGGGGQPDCEVGFRDASLLAVLHARVWSFRLDSHWSAPPFSSWPVRPLSRASTSSRCSSATSAIAASTTCLGWRVS